MICESTTGEQSATPNAPVASKTTGSAVDCCSSRCTSKAIVFLPTTLPEVGRITWNLE